MRKLLVRLFNLIYIIGAGVSIYALCTRPMLRAEVTTKFTKEQMSEFLMIAFKIDNTSETNQTEEESRFTYRSVANPSKKEMSDYVTKEKIQTYFPNGYRVTIPVSIPVTSAFNLKNERLLDELIEDNIDVMADKLTASLNDPLHKLFKDIFEGYATDSLRKSINQQIDQKFPGALEVTDEELENVFKNVYGLLGDEGYVTAEELAEAVLHGNNDGTGVIDIINKRGDKYVPYEEQPTAEQVEADRDKGDDGIYFVLDKVVYLHNIHDYDANTVYYEKVGEHQYVLMDPQPTEEQVNNDTLAPEEEQLYFLQRKDYVHNTEAYSDEVVYYQRLKYSDSEVDDMKITNEMIKSLEDVDGLVSKIPHECNPQPTQEQVEEDIAKEKQEDRIYYVLDENNEPVLPTEYNAEVKYYTVEKVVNDVETAMSVLIDSFLNGNYSTSKAVIRTRDGQQSNTEKSYESLKEAIKNYLIRVFPKQITEKSGAVGKNAPFIFLGVLALFALPWAWFILVTLIRTFRKDKCWTRPGIVIWGALLQVILGLTLTYGSNYGWTYLAERFDFLKQFAQAFDFDIRTGCLIPSFIWLGFFALTIPYIIIRRPLKKRYKLEKHFTRRQPRPVRKMK